MILKAIMAIMIFVIVPFLLGMLITKFLKKERNDLFFAYFFGYIIEFAICELISVPMIFKQVSYTTFLKTYITIIGFLSIVSFVINLTRIKEIVKENLKAIKKFPKILSIICLILIGIQMYMYVTYTHIDDDDAFYIGTSVTSIQTDSLYKYSPTTGATSGEHTVLRYRLAPFPLYIASISSLLDIHPAIVSHLIFPGVMLLVVYSVYYLLAKEIFKEDRALALLFVILINILNIFGGYSVRTNFTFLLFRIWQGKALLCNLILPAIWLVVLKASENNYNLVYCIILIILNTAGNLTTTMAIGLSPIVLVSLVFVLEFVNFKPKKFITNMIKSVICCLPSIVYGLIYFL